MPRLEWGTIGLRFFEAGVDRGVLYVGTNPGVPWNGLIAINEEADGGEAEPLYFDGQKYFDKMTPEDYSASLEAFASPYEFDVCDGTRHIQQGLFVGKQPRRPFGLSYRTGVGNDVLGRELGYKLHMIYNIMAQPSTRARQTVGDSIEPATLTWALSATPVTITGHKPSAHFWVDSRFTPPEILAELEDVLYGTPETLPRMPTTQELLVIFGQEIEHEDLDVTLLGGGLFSAEGNDVVPMIGDLYSIDHELVELGIDGTFSIL